MDPRSLPGELTGIASAQTLGKKKMSDHNARWKENGKKIILTAQYWIWIWVVLFAALYLNDPAPHTFLAVSIPLGLLWLVLITLTWRHNSFLLFLITAVVCRSSLSIAYSFFNLENQVQEIQGLALGFATVGAFMMFTRACVLRFGNLGEFKREAQQDGAGQPPTRSEFE
ncbi:hypothetical protein ACFQY0_21050 [Haloferula chungangensis]|uniref:Uncharacterized protein n=1 Tax=Haloferula chungangensis TaxID=1048331 RepID=A0ABW2LDU2_9BACT